jgi:hypothetical protein
MIFVKTLSLFTPYIWITLNLNELYLLFVLLAISNNFLKTISYVIAMSY